MSPLLNDMITPSFLFYGQRGWESGRVGLRWGKSAGGDIAAWRLLKFPDSDSPFDDTVDVLQLDDGLGVCVYQQLYSYTAEADIKIG